MQRLWIIVCFLMMVNGLTVDAQDDSDPEYPIITSENARNLTVVERIGRGAIRQLLWSSDERFLFILSTMGVWMIDRQQPDAEPRLFSTSGIPSTAGLSDDNNLLAVASCDETLRNTSFRTLLSYWQGYPEYCNHSLVQVWNLDFPERSPIEIGGGAYFINQLIFLTQNQGLLGFSGYDTAFIWNGVTTRIIRNIETPVDGAASVRAMISSQGDELGLLVRSRLEQSAGPFRTYLIPMEVLTDPGRRIEQTDIQTIEFFSPNVGLEEVTGSDFIGGNYLAWSNRSILNVSQNSWLALPEGLSYISISPDGRFLTAVQDRNLVWWLLDDLRAGIAEPLQQTPVGDIFLDHQSSLSFSPDGRWLTGTGRQSLHLWDEAGVMRASMPYASFASGYNSPTWSPSSHYLAYVADDHTLHIYDTETQTDEQLLDGFFSWTNGVTYLTNGELIYTACGVERVEGAGRTCQPVSLNSPQGQVILDPTLGRANIISLVNDEAIAGSGRTVSLRDTSTGELLYQEAEGNSYLYRTNLDATSDRQHLITSGGNGIFVWDVPAILSGAEPQLFAAPEAAIMDTALNPDETILAAVEWGWETTLLRLYHFQTGALLLEFPVVSDDEFPSQQVTLHTVAFNEDGSQIIVGACLDTSDTGGDAPATCYESAIYGLNFDGTTIARAFVLPSGPGFPTNLLYSADGSLIVASTRQAGNTGVYMWDSATGELLMREPLPSPVQIAFSPDGRQLAASNDLGYIAIFAVDE